MVDRNKSSLISNKLQNAHQSEFKVSFKDNVQGKVMHMEDKFDKQGGKTAEGRQGNRINCAFLENGSTTTHITMQYEKLGKSVIKSMAI